MKPNIAHTLKNYNFKNVPKDLIAGIIIMAVSIPISMGYAQIAGLPAVYGLYGSVFPIILFALLSTSPQFIFGVDAAPAALVGAAVLSMGIESGSSEAVTVVPVFTFFVALWLLAFYFMKAGKLVNYISAPVMGGFITGICTTIILMQVPKLMGGSSGADFFCSIVAAGVLFYEGRKTGQFYLRTGYGWIYHRNLHDDHTDAGAKTDGRNGRSRGTF